MCGIVGAVSTRNIVPILIEGLKRLEYRGYDSCGVAVHQNGQLRRARSTSRVAELEANVRSDEIPSGTGIAIVPRDCAANEAALGVIKVLPIIPARSVTLSLFRRRQPLSRRKCRPY